jgi:integrase
MMTDPIKKVVLKDGRTRYRFVVDIGPDPKTGKRQQKTFTYDLKRDAVSERARILSEVNDGRYVRPSKMTLNEHLDEWLPAVLAGSARRRNRALADSTRRNYEDALRPARDRLGTKQLQAITKADVEQLKTWMLTEGRRRGGKPGTGLSGRSVALTLGRLTAALEMAVREGKLVRNVAALVEPPPHDKRQRQAWTAEQAREFLKVAERDRLHAAWRMSLYGLRRGEVLGLFWESIEWGSFAEPCAAHAEKWCAPCYGVAEGYRLTRVHVGPTRILVEYKIVEKGDPKSENGKRKLPLDAATSAALRSLWVQQAKERLAAGAAYTESGRIVVDEIGEPVHPEWYSDEFGRLLKQAKLPRLVLHEARHTALSLLAKSREIPPPILQAWAGHHDARFTMANYVHVDDEDLSAGALVLGTLYSTAT